MPTDRRSMLQHLTLGGLALTAAPTSAHALSAFVRAASRAEETDAMQQESFDVAWTKKLTGKHKAVYDCPDIGSGLGVLRSGIVAKQYMDTLHVPASAISNVIVLRHDGIMLAMNQAFWDAYKIGEEKKVMHPWTGAPLAKNPALLRAGDGLPAGLENHAVDRQIERGVIVLACALAFQDVVDLVAAADKSAADAARAKARSMMIPGIVMQPSGVFAANLAQEQGCVYVRAT